MESKIEEKIRKTIGEVIKIEREAKKPEKYEKKRVILNKIEENSEKGVDILARNLARIAQGKGAKETKEIFRKIEGLGLEEGKMRNTKLMVMYGEAKGLDGGRTGKKEDGENYNKSETGDEVAKEGAKFIKEMKFVIDDYRKYLDLNGKERQEKSEEEDIVGDIIIEVMKRIGIESGGKMVELIVQEKQATLNPPRPIYPFTKYPVKIFRG